MDNFFLQFLLCKVISVFTQHMFRRKVFLKENYSLNEVDSRSLELEGTLKKVTKLPEIMERRERRKNKRKLNE